MKKAKALGIILICILGIVLLYVRFILPFSCNDIFDLKNPLTGFECVLSSYYAAGNVPVDFTIDKYGNLYVLSQNNLLSVPKKYGDEDDFYPFVKVKTGFSSPVCTFMPVKRMSLDSIKNVLYFVLPASQKESIVYRLKDGKCEKVLQTSAPVLSVAAMNGNLLVTTRDNIFVSFDEGKSFENLTDKLKTSSEKDSFIVGSGYDNGMHMLYSFTDPPNGIYYFSSPFLNRSVVFGTDCFKNIDNARQVRFLFQKVTESGVIFKEIPIENSKACFIEFPLTLSAYEPPSMPQCYVTNVKDLLNGKTGAHRIVNASVKKLTVPREIHVIYDALYFKNHLIFATDSGIWTYSFTFGKWYQHKELLYYLASGFDFSVRKLAIYKGRLLFLVLSPNIMGIYGVGLKK